MGVVSEQMLACPFCGGEPSVERSFSGGPYILCTDCGAATMFAGNTPLAVAAWNRRAAILKSTETPNG